MEIHGLTEFQRDLMRTSRKLPKQMPKIMRKIGSKARTHVAKKSRQLIKKDTGLYHKKWKRGKVFTNNGEIVVRIYNSAPHAHLLEEGHRQVTKDGREVGFVRGKYPMKKGIQEFESSGMVDDMFSEWIDQMLRENKL